MLAHCRVDERSFSHVAKEAATKDGDEDDEDKSPNPSATTGKTKKLTNQFNFSERASQTYNNPCRVRP